MRMRKKKHGEERLKLLSALFLSPNDTDCGVFYEEKPYRLEIGCGKGDFITGLSLKEPNYNYIAVEKMSDVIVLAAEKYVRSRGLGELAPNGGMLTSKGELVPLGDVWSLDAEEAGNVRFLCGDAVDLRKYFGGIRFSDIFVNFCDPWTRQNRPKRRLTYPDFLKMYEDLLVTGGTFRLKTDNVELFDYSVETVGASGLKPYFITRDLHSSEYAQDNVMTEYERSFSSLGVKINAIYARKE